MRLLVTFAVDAEFAPWRRLREFTLKHDGFRKLQFVKLDDLEVNVLLTGIGGKSAWIESVRKLSDGNMDICISSGLAGGLRAEYRLGDILTPKTVNAAVLRKYVPTDAALRRLALEAGALEVESFYSAETVILSSGEKQKLGEHSDAVEMESGQVLYEAAAFGARVIAIRSISDAVEEDLPLDFNRVTTANGEVSISRVLGQVARNPGKVPSLIRFGQQSRMAAAKLCEFLDRYVASLAKAAPELAKVVAK